MRYIKLYESIGGSYYQEISSNEYSIRASGNTDFTEEEEQEFIKKTGKNYLIQKFRKLWNIFRKNVNQPKR